MAYFSKFLVGQRGGDAQPALLSLGAQRRGVLWPWLRSTLHTYAKTHSAEDRAFARRRQSPTIARRPEEQTMSDPTPAAQANTHPTAPVRPIRRTELRKLVPLADSTIYDLEQRGDFPRRFALTRRCVVWDRAEVEAWLAKRKADPIVNDERAPGPDVRLRRSRPVARSIAAARRR